MKRITALILLSVMLMPVIASAEDMVLTASVQRVLTKITKTGDPMVIVFIQEQRTLNGVTYTADAPVFASGAAKGEVEQLKDGDTLKAIVSKRQANGDITYTLRKVIK